MSIHASFKRSYTDARTQFITLVEACGGALESFLHPLTGPEGESLFLDVARWGDPSAETLVVVTSGTHGIEGYAGSGLQAALLRDDVALLSPDAGLLMVHAVNPYGFAWRRRVNENNVDLNRNFIDHAKPHPRNDRYAELADLVAPRAWNAEVLAGIQKGLAAYAETEGAGALQAALSGGQYDYPEGIFFGGRQPEWSNERMRDVARRHLSSAKRVFMVDIHTGLGDYGDAECIVECPPGDERMAVASEIWGERLRNTHSGQSLSSIVSGSVVSGLTEEVPGQLVGVGLEYGTVPIAQVMVALLADRWVHCHGDPRSRQGQEIGQQMFDAFFGDTDAWRQSVVDIGRDVIGRVFDHIGRG